MPVRVLVVDDSSFFRRQITKILAEDPRLEVIDTAADGKEAVDKALKLKPDVITMDIEMPVMDGITATRHIMQQSPRPILMFSSLSTEGAKATLDALDAGAVDYLPKRFEEIAKDSAIAKKRLCEQVYTVGTHRPSLRPPVSRLAASGAQPSAAVPRSSSARGKKLDILAIGTSTGGPMALQDILTHIPGDFPLPIVIIQHMPGSFTPAFAQRLNTICQITIKEAADGDVLSPGVAYLAPGGKQMSVVKRGQQYSIRIVDGEPSQTYKPSVDITFNSLAEVTAGKVLAVVLTGMGADGREGAKALKEKGALIWAQDEASCVVYGMPHAVVEAGITDKIVQLSDMANQIVKQAH